MIALRDYQQDLLERSQTALAPEGARVMTQLPTGGGKTEIAGALLKDFLVGGRKAVWLTHREELANQTEERLSLNWSVSAMSGTDSWSPRRPAPRIVNGVVILKAQTVSRRNKGSAFVWDNFGPEDLLVIDEAHHAPATGWERAIKQWPGKVWGLTATPWRLSLREGFDHLFHNLVTGPQTAEMQANGYLALSRVFAPTPGDRISGGEVGQLGDFTEGGIERANDRFVMTTLAVNFWRNLADGRQTVAYAVSKGHAANLVRAFTDRGISAASILSDTPTDEREQTIADFRNGKLTVLVNVAVATEGFDLPDASCVMITRPTKSLALYLQMVGRGLRPKPDDGDCLILDLAGNAEEHGLPEDYREWSLAARGNPVAGDSPVRYCHECNYMAHPAHHNCPECGTDLGKPCPRCCKFRPWSRWTEEGNCRHEHESVCDRCHPDKHAEIGIGSRSRKRCDYCRRSRLLSDWTRELLCEVNHEPVCDDCDDNFHRSIGLPQWPHSLDTFVEPTGYNSYINQAIDNSRISSSTDWNAVVSDLVNGIALAPESAKIARAYAIRGVAFHNLKQYDDAIGDFNIAIELSPQFTFAYKYRADSFLAIERYQEAIDNYSQAIELQVSDSSLYANRASAFRKAGRSDDALSDYSIAIHLTEDDNYSGFLYLMRASIHIELGSIESSKADFASIETKISPDSDSFGIVILCGMYERRAKMYEELGCHDEAELDRQKAKELNDKIAARSNSNQD